LSADPAATPATGARVLLALVVAMVVLRLATLGSYPLMDTSEARYGEIARVMLATGNYVTPQEVPGTPFWAKPPLYAWLSVASVRLLGVNEFALRLPSLLCALAVLALCAAWAASLGTARSASQRRRAGLLAAALLAVMPGFFADAGAVMTDPSLALCSTAALACFHQVAIAGTRSVLWRYGFFVALGLGMLAKGPVVLLYAGLPIALWALWQRRLLSLWRALPWIGGSVLAALICVPWYLLAEQRTPGFLSYFLLGEHVMRFLQPGWTGDRYGTAHAEPMGTIWIYLAGALGLLLLLAGAAALQAWRGRRGRQLASAADTAGLRLLLLASFVPVAFFSFAGNIIWTYVVPVLGPLAVLLADRLAERLDAGCWWRGIAAVLAAAALSLAAVVLILVPPHFSSHSAAGLVAQWREQQAMAPGDLVYVGRKVPASLRFYSGGTVPGIAELPQALAVMGLVPDRYLALAPPRFDELQRYAAASHPPLLVSVVDQNKDLMLVRVHATALAPP